MVKKIFSVMLILIMVLASMGAVSVWAYEVTVFVDGEQVLFDQLPVIENGRTLVPVRAIAEKLGADVEWNNDTRTATVTRGTDVVMMTIDSSAITKNGFKITVDQPAVIRGGRTLIPARALAESMDCKVDWNHETYRVDIMKVADESFDALENFMAEKGVKTDNSYFICCPADILTGKTEYRGINVNASCFAGANRIEMWYSYGKNEKSGKITLWRGADDYTFEATEKFSAVDSTGLLLRKDAYFAMPQNIALVTGNIARSCAVTQQEAEVIATDSLETVLMLSDTMLAKLGAPVTLKDLGFINYTVNK